MAHGGVHVDRLDRIAAPEVNRIERLAEPQKIAVVGDCCPGLRPPARSKALGALATEPNATCRPPISRLRAPIARVQGELRGASPICASTSVGSKRTRFEAGSSRPRPPSGSRARRRAGNRSRSPSAPSAPPDGSIRARRVDTSSMGGNGEMGCAGGAVEAGAAPRSRRRLRPESCGWSSADMAFPVAIAESGGGSGREHDETGLRQRTLTLRPSAAFPLPVGEERPLPLRGKVAAKRPDEGLPRDSIGVGRARLARNWHRDMRIWTGYFAALSFGGSLRAASGSAVLPAAKRAISHDRNNATASLLRSSG